MDTVELHLGILQRVAFFILCAARIFRDMLSQFFWYLIAKPLVIIAFALCGRETDDGYKRIIFKKDVLWQHIIGMFIKSVLALNGWLNGLKSRYSAYDFLLKWNPSIPLIALRNKPTHTTIDWLGKQEDGHEGYYPIDGMTWLGTSSVHGYFTIISKQLIENSPKRIAIECVWLTGENKGELFTVTYFSFSDAQQSATFPDSIYFPPRVVVWCFDSLLSLSAAGALFGIAYHVWQQLADSQIYKTLVTHINLMINLTGK